MGQHRRLIIELSAPSGAGKTTLIQELIKNDPSLSLAISCTTRSPRAGERDGEEYHFVSHADFARMQNEKLFAEWAVVHEHFYGTLTSEVISRSEPGKGVILNLDWQGAAKIRQKFPLATTIFIFPPSREALESRLRNRGTDSDETIRRRLWNAEEEIRHAPDFSYFVCNDRLSDAVTELTRIIKSVRETGSASLVMHRNTTRLNQCMKACSVSPSSALQ